MLVEWALIRHLYKRPLDTLLATWGLSLILQQAYRSVFGAREVGVELPDWMMGSLHVTDSIEIPINGMFVMGLTVLITVAVRLRHVQVALGPAGARHGAEPHHGRRRRHQHREGRPLHLRARLRHRRHRRRAFTTIGSTGPTSGQLYIVDTFLVVVFGGAASLLGTIASAFSISQTQSTLEFFMSGSMAKVLTLLAVVGILMLRPQGLFALKVRK